MWCHLIFSPGGATFFILPVWFLQHWKPIIMRELLTDSWSLAVKKSKYWKKTATPFKNSVVIGHCHKNAKVTAIKQEISK
jgi:hypothetical protein